MRRGPKQGRWGDLPKRMFSAIIMLGVGAIDVWMGGLSFAILVLILTGVMVWELMRMQAPRATWVALAMGILATAFLYAALVLPLDDLWPAMLMVPALICAALVSHRKVAGIYAFAIMIAGYTLIELRDEQGRAVILWLVALVVASDVMGYFVGRSLGGPKFWPRISPNKTWSGTIAGWVGAALVGLAFVVIEDEPWMLVILSPIIALAGQLGDIAESWIKRRAQVKDSSRLIPGHGGVLDRFDALLGAVVAIMLLSLLFPLPLPDGL